MSYLSLRSLQAVALLLVGLGLPVLALEPQALIPWNANLNTGAGVSTVVVQARSDGANGLLLQGTVVLPAQQSEVVSMPAAGVV